MDVAVSCDGTWQRRGHQSLYGIQAAIAADTIKVLDYEIQSKYCAECQAHSGWDQTTTNYQTWKAGHHPTCNINYSASSNSMEAFGAEQMWCRSLKKHNLRYTIYIGDGDSASYERIVHANPYGETPVQKSDCCGHIQKRMGNALRRLITTEKDSQVFPVEPGTRKRTGIGGKNGLTKKIIDQMQNYYGMAIRAHIGDKDGMIRAIRAIFSHFSNSHEYCPGDETTWCKYKRKDPKYKPKTIAPEVLKKIEPIFERLSDPEFLERVQRGDTQNPNEALHSQIWLRSPKHIFASPEAIRVSTALAVIQRNVGNVGLLQVLEKMGITNNDISRRLLERMDSYKEKKRAKKNLPETKKRRQLIRGKRKKAQDKLEESEGPSYQAGAFYVPDDDQPGPSGIAKKQPKKNKGQKAKPAETSQTTEPAEEVQPAKKKAKEQTTTPDEFVYDASLDTQPAAEPTRRSTRVRHPTERSHAYVYTEDYVDFA